MKATAIQILETTDYDVFKPHGEQQKMHPPHVKKMKISMQRNGFIKAKPIHCYKEGKFLRVIDGHHRLRAAQELGIPVCYVVGEFTDRELIADENWAVRKWMNESFVNMYVSRGYKDYLTLVSYINRGLDLKFAVSLLVGETTASGNQNDNIRNGTFKIKTTEYADEVLRIVNSLSGCTAEAKGRAFLSSIAILIRLPEFNADTLISRIQTNPRMLVKCATREQMLDLIEEIYNFRAREKANLAFKAAELLAQRQKAMK